jgi:hypothetical protein
MLNDETPDKIKELGKEHQAWIDCAMESLSEAQREVAFEFCKAIKASLLQLASNPLVQASMTAAELVVAVKVGVAAVIHVLDQTEKMDLNKLREQK